MPHFPKPFFKKSRGLWYVEIDRKQIKLGPDRDAAFATYHKLMGEPRPTAVRSDQLSIIIDAFLEWSQRQRSACTYEWYRYRLQRFITRTGDMPAAQLRPYHVQQWVDGYQLSVTSRRNYMRSVKRCLAWAVRQGYLEKNPIEFLEIPSGEAREVVVTQAEFDQLLDFVKDDPFRDLLIITWETGCRPQESLRVEAK